MRKSDGRPPGRPDANGVTTSPSEYTPPLPLPDGIEDPYQLERERLAICKALRALELARLGLSPIESFDIDELRRDLGMHYAGESL